MSDLARAIVAGDRRALARGVRIVEERREGFDALLRSVAPESGRAHRVGITGPPGVGKSTLVTALVAEARRRGSRPGVLAVDPSSPITGGALLGDRIRMGQHALDEDVFVRSMATRGALGGLSTAAGDALDLMDAAGFDPLFLETAGAGQTDHEVAATVESTLVVLAPGLGDAIQAMKGGLIEIADFWIVNKGDDPRAEQVRIDLVSSLALRTEGDQDVEDRVLVVTATTGDGVAPLLDALDARLRSLEEQGRRPEIRKETVLHRIRTAVRERVESLAHLDRMRQDVDGVLAGKISVHEAAAAWMEAGGAGPLTGDPS